MSIYTFREHLTHFSNVKSFTFFTLELVYKVGGFAVSKDGNGISEAGVGAGKRLGGDVDPIVFREANYFSWRLLMNEKLWTLQFIT